MIAKIEIECQNPDMIIKSLEPDVDKQEKFNVKLDSNKNKILLTVESKEVSGLLAGINSYTRLIKPAIGVENIAWNEIAPTSSTIDYANAESAATIAKHNDPKREFDCSAYRNRKSFNRIEKAFW